MPPASGSPASTSSSAPLVAGGDTPPAGTRVAARPPLRCGLDAVRAGAKVEMPVMDQFWGDRYGRLKDPFGHKWSIATHTKDMSADEMKHAMDDAMAKMQKTA